MATRRDAAGLDEVMRVLATPIVAGDQRVDAPSRVVLVRDRLPPGGELIAAVRELREIGDSRVVIATSNRSLPARVRGRIVEWLRHSR